MISVQEALLDSITAAFHELRTGRVPPPIRIPDDLPDNEARQLITYVNRFIRETFGRYTSDDIVGVLLDLPEGLKLGGEKREITLLMSDLRGFTALSEGLEPTEVIALLNRYLSAMVELIHRHGGTIDEIIGDAIFVLFGAPLPMPDAAQRAARCALEMQKAMGGVNQHHVQMGWPEIEMGIGLHAGEVVVGNIGSIKRSKYGVVGRTVNLTARIESFTVGGQVLASPALIRAAAPGLLLGDEVEVHAKGMREALKCRQLLGLEGHPELLLKEDVAAFTALAKPISFFCVALTDKHLDEKMHPGAPPAVDRLRPGASLPGGRAALPDSERGRVLKTPEKTVWRVQGPV
jgi:adenylate cyclase